MCTFKIPEKRSGFPLNDFSSWFISTTDSGILPASSLQEKSGACLSISVRKYPLNGRSNTEHWMLRKKEYNVVKLASAAAIGHGFL
ncbi:hypothetical protein NL676_021161 [Syzygium grande]|nr:hypothetical protein NL676_021161 [Syzygium grande]